MEGWLAGWAGGGAEGSPSMGLDFKMECVKMAMVGWGCSSGKMLAV